MPALRKTVRQGRAELTPGARARNPAAKQQAGAGFQPAEERAVTEEQRDAVAVEATPYDPSDPFDPANARNYAEAETDGGGGIRPSLIEQARDSAAGDEAPPLGSAPAAEKVLNGAELIEMVTMFRGALVAAAAEMHGVGGPEVDALIELDEKVRLRLLPFSDSAVKFLPWLNAHVDLIGCVLFFGILGMDTNVALKRISALGKERAAENRRATQSSGAQAVPQGPAARVDYPSPAG